MLPGEEEKSSSERKIVNFLYEIPNKDNEVGFNWLQQ
jgi:hypothetical protein